MQNLTTQKYWEDYYKSASIDVSRIKKVISVYDDLWDFLMKHNISRNPQTILEIGGYPGRYLAYLADKYKLKPTSIDYNSDKQKIIDTMHAFNVSKYEIIQEDIFKYVSNDNYDIVLSNGFIEHFENYNEALDKHCQFLKPGGTMLIMIPNKRWVRRWYGYLLDNKNLRAHNLNCMRRKVFLDFGKRNNLEILGVGYRGGFQYALHQKPNFIQKIIYRAVRQIALKMNPLISMRPNKYFSSLIVAIYRKPL